MKRAYSRARGGRPGFIQSNVSDSLKGQWRVIVRMCEEAEVYYAVIALVVTWAPVFIYVPVCMRGKLYSLLVNTICLCKQPLRVRVGHIWFMYDPADGDTCFRWKLRH